MKITNLKASYHFGAAVTKEGDLYTWGQGENGALGHGKKRNVMKPKLVEFFADKKILCATFGS